MNGVCGKKKNAGASANRAKLSVTCSAGQDCSNTWRKALLCPFFCTACSANHTTQGGDASASGMISTPDGCKHTVKGNSRPHTHTKSQNKLCCLTTIGASSRGGSVCPGALA